MNSPAWWFVVFYLTVSIICVSGLSSSAQNRVFDHYGPKDGLVTSQVLGITKDRQGFLWLGTENGLARFDGHTFRYFLHDYKDKKTLSSNYISDIQCDNHDRIWVSSGRNLDIFDIKTGKVQRYQDNIFKDNTPRITHIYHDNKNDTLWITTSKGIFYHAGKEIVLHEKKFPGIEGTIHDMQKVDRYRYVFAGDKAVFLYDSEKGKTSVYYHAYHKKEFDDGFLCVFVENDSMVWAGSWVHGLLQINLFSGHTKTFTYKNVLIGQNGILDIQKPETTGDEIFLATTDGIKTFNTKTLSFHSYATENIYDANGIAGAGFTFFADKTSLWAGTYKGLHKYDLLKNFIRNIPLKIGSLSAVPQPQDLCFERMKNGRDSIIWVSFPYEGIHRYDLSNQKEIEMPGALAPILAHKKTGPYAMYIDGDNILWISTENHPLLIFDIHKNTLIKPEFSDPFKGPVLQFSPDKSGNVWLATRETWYVVKKRGIKIYVSEKKQLRQSMQKTYSVMEPVPYLFAFDSKNNIWFLGFDKIKNQRFPVYYDFTKRKAHVFSYEKYPELQQLGWLDGLMVKSDDAVWISGFSGFGWIQKQVDSFQFKPYLSTSKINPKPSKFAVEDYIGNLIMSTDFGIAYLNKDNGLLSNFSYYNCSIGPGIQPGIFISPNTRKIYLGQKSSLDYFDPGNVRFPPPGEIRLADISIRRFLPKEKIRNGDVIHLRHDQNQIHLSVTNLFFTNANDSKYFYRLSDNDPWTENPDNNFHFYNLSPGNYSLQIKSSNAFGVMGKDIFSLGFNISPPFYKAWWFYLLLSIASIAVVYAVFWYRDQQRKKLEKLRHHIARDLHDDLGSSLSYIRILSESEARKTKDNLSFRNISEKTAEIMNNMSEIIWSINPVYDSFNNIVTRLQDFAIDTLEPLDIKLKFDIDTLPDKYKLSPEKRRQYYLIFKEAINNAAKYSKAKKIRLTIRQENKTIITILEDDGIGFDGLLIQKGNGLKNMKSRADFLGGILHIETSDQGTKVQLTLKI